MKESLIQSELEDLAKYYKKRCLYFVFDRSEIYSFGRIIKTMGFYPRFLPLCLVTDHSGPNYAKTPFNYELDNRSQDFFTHTHEKGLIFERETNAKSYVIQNPFEWYYKKNQHRFSAVDKEFVTFFPVHHLPSETKEIYDIRATIKLVQELEKNYGKIRVCLHKHDIDKGIHIQYLKAGFSVVTAGNSLDDRFVDRFLEIILASKLVISNHIGSIFFYSHMFKREFVLLDDGYIEVQSEIDRVIRDKLKLGFSINDEVFEKEINKIYSKEKIISRRRICLVLYANLFRRILRSSVDVFKRQY